MKYIKKIIIENFQSHRYTEIDFDADLNVIIGQSDKGKSAILRALKWVLYNEPRGTDFIRYGTNECSVTIFMGDGNIVCRKRRKNKNIYTVTTPNSELLEFENFGNEVPPEVIEATGVKKIKLDTDSDAKLNFNEQLDPPFLLAETGTIRAKSIGRIVNTNIIDAAERDIMKDISNNNIAIKNFERQLDEIEIELDKYSDIDDLEKIINIIDNLLSKIDSTNSSVEKLNENKSKIDSITNQIFYNQNIIKKLKDISIIGDKYTELKEKYNTCQQLRNFNSKLDLINENLVKNNCITDKLKNLTILSENIIVLNEKYRLFNIIKELNDKVNTINTNINSNTSILFKTKNIDNIENSIKTIHTKIEVAEQLLNSNNKLSDINSSISKGEDYLRSLLTNLKLKVTQYSKSLKELGKCPTCYCIIDETTVSQIINEMEGDINVN